MFLSEKPGYPRNCKKAAALSRTRELEAIWPYSIWSEMLLGSISAPSACNCCASCALNSSVREGSCSKMPLICSGLTVGWISRELSRLVWPGASSELDRGELLPGASEGVSKVEVVDGS